ncbi:MAG: hypothetical protein KDJ47_02975 [Hyphomicrobiaceae bacterium]|nr:hypothetical protein [Hyphomicrobiaceae bacterium]
MNLRAADPSVRRFRLQALLTRDTLQFDEIQSALDPFVLGMFSTLNRYSLQLKMA